MQRDALPSSDLARSASSELIEPREVQIERWTVAACSPKLVSSFPLLAPRLFDSGRVTSIQRGSWRSELFFRTFWLF